MKEFSCAFAYVLRTFLPLIYVFFSYFELVLLSSRLHPRFNQLARCVEPLSMP